MAAIMGWYGPLIDLSNAASHIGDYVQLLVFIHRITPVQYKIARNGGEVVRMDVLVGDETRSYFPVTIWQKDMGSKLLAGHVFLLQNLKITRFGDAIEARTFYNSSLQCLIHKSDFETTKGVDELVKECRVGALVRSKLEKVVGWLQRARLVHCGSVLNYYEHRMQLKVNWKVQEEILSQDCLSISEVCQLKNSSKANFHASIGEIFLPITWINLNETEAERMFLSRRLQTLGDGNLIDDLISNGCQKCGIPVNATTGSSVEPNPFPLYCQKSSDRLHVMGTIYRPFLLYVWDDLKYVPISVSNKAAEILFGNITAEKVYSCYQICSEKHTALKRNKTCEVNIGESCAARGDITNHDQVDGKPNFYIIWLVLLKMMFQHGKNSTLKFKVRVDTSRDLESGKFEMVSVSMPVAGGNFST